MYKIIKFFDKLEDKIRGKLSHWPIIYAFIGGIGIVLFWRGVWLTADLLPFMTGPFSILISIIILLFTGLFVSFFIGHYIILSGLRQEKRIEEKEEAEIEIELDLQQAQMKVLVEIKNKIEKIEKTIDNINSK